MEKFNLCNTLNIYTENLLENIGFTYVGEDDELLAAYADEDSVLVYDTRYPYFEIIKYSNLEGERDEFLMACVENNAVNKFPYVQLDVYNSIPEMLNNMIYG